MQKSNSARGFLERGIEHINEGRFSAALAEWERGLEIDPEDVDLLGNVAWFHFNRSRFAKALTYYSSLTTVAPRSVEAFTRVGNCLESLGLIADAIQYYSHAAEIDPGSPTAAQALKRLEQKEESDRRKPPFIDALLTSGPGRAFLEVFCAAGLGMVSLCRRIGEGAPRDRIPRSLIGKYVRFLKRFDPRYGKREDTFYKCAEVADLSGMIPMASGVRLLDLGSGDSPFPAFAASLGCQVICLDASPYGFETIQKMAEPLGRRGVRISGTLDPVVGDFRHLPFGSESFDAVTAICTLEHVPGDGDIEGIREIARVLALGGRAFISVEARYQSDEEWLEVPLHGEYVYGEEKTREMPETETARLIEKAQNRVTTVFVRYYSPGDMERRLVEPSGLNGVSRGVLAGRGKKDWRGRFNPRLSPRFGRLLAPLSPLAGTVLFRHMEPDEFVRRRKLGIGTLVLEKSGTSSRDRQ